MGSGVKDGNVKNDVEGTFVGENGSLCCNLSILSAVADLLSSMDSRTSYDEAERRFLSWCNKQGLGLDDVSFVFSYSDNTESEHVFTTRVLPTPSRATDYKICKLTYISEHEMEFEIGLVGYLLIPDCLSEILPASVVRDINRIKGAISDFLYNSKSVNVLVRMKVKNTPFPLSRVYPYRVPYDSFVWVLLNWIQDNFDTVYLVRGLPLDAVYSHINMYFNIVCELYKGGL